LDKVDKIYLNGIFFCSDSTLKNPRVRSSILIIFINIKPGDKKMNNITYDSSFIKNRWPFPFMWGDWKCLLEIPDNPGSKYNPLRNPEAMNIATVEELDSRLIGFELKVSFSQARDLDEIKTKLVELAEISSKIDVAGIKTDPGFGVNHPGPGLLQSREGNIYNWFLKIQQLRANAPDHCLRYCVTLDYLYLQFDMRYGLDKRYLGKLNEETFRLKFILTCISNWLNIPVDLNF
jgi:hypothetical protein